MKTSTVIGLLLSAALGGCETPMFPPTSLLTLTLLGDSSMLSLSVLSCSGRREPQHQDNLNGDLVVLRHGAQSLVRGDILVDVSRMQHELHNQRVDQDPVGAFFLTDIAEVNGALNIGLRIPDTSWSRVAVAIDRSQYDHLVEFVDNLETRCAPTRFVSPIASAHAAGATRRTSTTH